MRHFTGFRYRWLVLAVLPILAACERDVTLVEPGDFFEFDPANAWRVCTPGRAPAPPAHPAPEPTGVTLEACPNPASATLDRSVLFRIRLDQSMQDVNLAVFDDRGRLIRALIVARRLERDLFHQFSWRIEDLPPGDYRAYFRAGRLESHGDLRIDP